MRLGIIGLRRMGGNIARRLIAGGHGCVVYDRDAAAWRALGDAGATIADDLAALVAKLAPPRALWMMLAAGAATEQAIADLTALLAPGDIVIDGGNTFYRDDVPRADEPRAKSIHYVDVGTSGGVWRLERRCCLMIGGEPIEAHLDLVFAEAQAADTAPERYSDVVEDSGEGRWTIMTAIEEVVPANVLSVALYARFRWRQDHTFAEKILSAMRKGFGGHVEPTNKAQARRSVA